MKTRISKATGQIQIKSGHVHFPPGAHWLLGGVWGSHIPTGSRHQLKQTLFNCEGGQTLEQGAQRGCGGSIPADTQHPAGHSAGQPAQLTQPEQRGWTR